MEVHQSQFVTAVTPSFNSGVQSLQLLLQVLVNTQTSWKSLSNNDANKILTSVSGHAQNAYDYFGKAEEVASRHKSTVDNKLEDYTLQEKLYQQELYDINSKIKQGEAGINAKKREIKSSESQIQDASNQVKQANHILSVAVDEMHHAENKRRSGIFGIPLIGDILAEVSGLRDKVRNTRNNVANAGNILQNFQRNFQLRVKEMESLQHNLNELERKRDEESWKLDKLKKDAKNLKQTQSDISKIRENLGRCTHFLSVMFGKTKVLRDEAQTVVARNLEPLVNVIGDISKHLKTNSGITTFDSHKKIIGQRLQFLSQKVTTRNLIDEL